MEDGAHEAMLFARSVVGWLVQLVQLGQSRVDEIGAWFLSVLGLWSGLSKREAAVPGS
jgi:hypothetical protein